MDEPAINECFRLLNLRRGADFAAVKQAYRRNLYKCHPDRFQAKPELLPVAERKTKRLVQVYGVLERWYETNGGTDPVGSFQYGEPASETDETPDMPPDDEGASNRARLFKAGLALAAVAAVLGFAALKFSPPAAVTERPPPADTTTSLRPPPPAVAQAPAVGRPAPAPTPQPHAVAAETRDAELRAVAAAAARAKSAWIASYLRDCEAEKGAAEGELAEARAQYVRDVQEKAADIRRAEDEAAPQIERARRDSAAAKDAFAAGEKAALGALRNEYDAWLLAQGDKAVSLVRGIRTREGAAIGAFSDTEDPRRIFEFWTAEEAGGPEVNIAAKTGITVLQPNDRFFPHFRSSIYLYNPEGQVLARMMEAIVERHDALLKELGERRLADEAALANWDATHPGEPVRLSRASELVMKARSAAIDRLSRARDRLAAAQLAASPMIADAAFSRSPTGRQWAARLLAAQGAAAQAKGAR